MDDNELSMQARNLGPTGDHMRDNKMTAYSLRGINLDPPHRFSTILAVLLLHVVLLFLLALGLAYRQLPTDDKHRPVVIQNLQFVEPITLKVQVENPPAAVRELKVAPSQDVAEPIEHLVPIVTVAPSTDQVARGSGSAVPGLIGPLGTPSGTGLGSPAARPSSSAVAIPARKRSGYISSEDYPRRALAAKAEGTTSASVTIGASGLVTACNVVSSSGRADLDATVCRLMSTRYRFEPGRNSQGEAVTEIRKETFTWILPAND